MADAKLSPGAEILGAMAEPVRAAAAEMVEADPRPEPIRVTVEAEGVEAVGSVVHVAYRVSVDGGGEGSRAFARALARLVRVHLMEKGGAVVAGGSEG